MLTNDKVVCAPQRRQAGFTLIELMIVVVIIAVLAGIAFASYTQHVVKSRRAAAAVCLQERAQLLERYYTTHLSYTDAPDPAQCDGIEQFYAVAWSEEPDARTYKLKATPQGAQERDTKCAVLSLDQAGTREVSGSSSVSECW